MSMQSHFFKTFTGCYEGEVRAHILKGSDQHKVAERLVRQGLLQRHPEGRRDGYSLTSAGKAKADARVAKIG